MPRSHTGLGTLIVPGQPDAKVVLHIAPEEHRGWDLVRGTIEGDPAALAAAFDNNRHADLVHDASGYRMSLTIVDVADGSVGRANVTVDVSKKPSSPTHDPA